MPKTIPVANELTKPFWDAVNEKRLVLQHCDDCGKLQYPIRPKCWHCGAADCPAGTANGVVDVHGQPKPAYRALERAAHGQFDLAALYPDCAALAEATMLDH